MDMVQTTKKDFKLFKKEFRKWQRFFGLKNWKVVLLHEDTEERGLADINSNISGYISTCKLSVNWPKCEYSKYQIRKTAFHECIHLLLARYAVAAKCRFINESELDEADHELVRILENTVFEKCQSSAL